MGHHLKSQYIDHMKKKALEKKKLGEKMFCTHEHKQRLQIVTVTRRRPIAASIFRCAGGRAGSFEKDVYFSAVPSQNQCCPHWRQSQSSCCGQVAQPPACLTLLLSASLRKKKKKKKCPQSLKFTPGSQKQAEGRHKSKCDSNMFASGENCSNYGVFINAGGGCSRGALPPF